MPYLMIALCLLLALVIIRLSLGRFAPSTSIGLAQTAGMREVQADAGGHCLRNGETLLVVADGIGSGIKGRMAAQVAVEIVTRQFEIGGAGQNPVYFFRSAFAAANAAILRHIPDATAGACLLAAVIQNGMLFYALAGNCNLFVCRGRRLYLVSKGQTMDELARQAFKEKRIGRAQTIQMVQDTRAYNFLGKDGLRELEIPQVPVRLQSGDVVLLATDGVQDALAAQELLPLLRERRGCAEKAKRLVETIENKRIPEQDNAFVVLARYQA